VPGANKTRGSSREERRQVGRQDGRQVSGDLAGSALDACVRKLFDLSWNRARELVRRGKVSVDGRAATDPVARVRAGATLVLDLAAPSPRAQALALPEGAIVHVDAHVVVVEKPAGISTVPYDPEGMAASIARRSRDTAEDATLDERVRALLAKRARGHGHGQGPPTLGVVHRLDKETSGLVVFTRTWEAKRALTSEFRRHTVHRRYLAIVHGDAKAGTIRSNLVPDRGDGLRGSVEKRRGRAHAVGSEKTQLAVTHVAVEERLPASAAGQPCTLVSCRLETGRTHQIRIHLSEAGHPLLGERVYVRGYPRAIVPAPRLMLHAAELGFVHPATGRDVRWTSPLPADMQEMLAFLRGNA
jgi:23S rRNA pseudouridine1911/1915/1917 synthase